MSECHNNVNGVCTIATYLARYETVALAHESTCEACIASDAPKGINKATCGLAVLYLRKEGVFSIEKHNALIECGETVVPSDGSCKNRPGLALKRILADIGIKENAGCPCQEYAASMDSWGWAGCLQRKQEIINHLNAQHVSWFDMLKVAASGYLTTDSIVTHALRLSDPN